MARWASLCTVGSVSFTDCRVELINPGPFKSPLVGSSDWANDGSVHVQTLNRGQKGIKFGLKFYSALGTKLQDVFDDIDTAAATQDGIELEVIEGIFHPHVIVVPDYDQDWFVFDRQSEGYYEGVQLLFTSLGPAA